LIKTKENNILGCTYPTEDVVRRELHRLPSTYYIFKDVCLSLYRPVNYRKTQDSINFCQIDFVVIGPKVIFIIEAKEWSEQILKETSDLPLKEADKAGLVFYIRIYNRFCKKFPIYNVVVMLQKVPKVTYEYVRHLTVREVYWFIVRREGILPKKKITKIVRWLTKISNRKAIIRRITT